MMVDGKDTSSEDRMTGHNRRDIRGLFQGYCCQTC